LHLSAREQSHVTVLIWAHRRLGGARRWSGLAQQDLDAEHLCRAFPA
jgi:hypothetical protein